MVRVLPRLWLVLLWLLLATGAVASERARLVVAQEGASVALDPWQRGHLHMYLEQNGIGCALAQKKDPRGELTLRLEVTVGQPTRVTILDETKLLPRSFPGCLRRILRNVQFSDLAPRFRWEGTLRYDDPLPFEVGVTSLYGKMMELTLQHVVIAALAQPAPCMERFFAATPALSMVALASFDVAPSGEVVGLQVTPSTAGPEGTVACVKQQLSTLTFPGKEISGARLRISLLRPVPAGAGVDAPTVILRTK